MGNQPSLRVSIQKERWHDVRHLMTTEDGRARARTKTYTVGDENISALHLACKHNAPPDVIDTLINTGQPLMISNPSQLSPLHCSLLAKKSASPETVRLLLDAFPHHVSQPTSRVTGAKTPLHMACEQKASSSIIRMLHDSDPTVVNVQDVRGETPSDLAKQHLWIMHPKWRRKVKRILTDTPSTQIGNAEISQVHAQVAAASSQSPPSSPAAGRPSSRPASPQSATQPPVVAATLVDDFDTTASQFPVAAATLVEPSAPSELMDVDTALEEKGVCVLCWERKAEMALVPCGHVCLCTNCCQQGDVLNAALQHQCPVCRGTFQQTLRVYHAGISSTSS